MADWWSAGGGGGGSDQWDKAQAQGGAKGTDAWKADEAAGASWEAAGDTAAAAPAQEDTWGAGAAAGGDAGGADGWGAGGGDSGGGGGDGAWGGGGGGGGGPQPTGRDFWESQEWSKSSGTLSRKDDWEWDQMEATLFQQEGRAQAGINFARYESVPVDVSGSKAENIPVCKTFEEIFVSFANYMPEALEGNVRRCHYTTPTPVQKFAIPVGLVGRDVMCCAQTGSGKTAAFLIPVIGRMMKDHPTPVGSLDAPFEGVCKPFSLVMTPTRELCLQIYEESLKFCFRTPYRVCRVYGGEKPKAQLEELAKGADLVIATPGRLKDFLDRAVMSVKEIRVLVLDEADRMLDMGFESQIREIVDTHDMPTKDKRQTLMFSATFPERCQQMAQDYLYDYIWIAVGVLGSAVETVEQNLVQVQPAKKFEMLVELLDQFYAERETRQTKDRMLIFVNSKDNARFLDQELYKKNMDSGALHGDLDQTERETNLGRFRRGEIDILIATDVAARGLDIENVAVVVNYDFPKEIDTYVHRIGRTGRIGNAGKAISYLAMDDSGEASLEGLALLKELSQVMTKSKGTLPAWFDTVVAATEGGSGGGWSWGAKDVRTGQDSYKATGAGDSWASWEASGGDGQTEWK